MCFWEMYIDIVLVVTFFMVVGIDIDISCGCDNLY